MLSKVDEDLVEFSSSQQVEVFNNLSGVETVNSHILLPMNRILNGQWQNLELFEQIRFLHHQGPEMLHVRKSGMSDCS